MPTLKAPQASGFNAQNTEKGIYNVFAENTCISDNIRDTSTVEMVKDRLNPDLKINGIIPCRVDKRTRFSMDVIDELKKRFNGIVYETCITETAKLVECPSFGQPTTIYDTKSPGTEDYRPLAKEVITRKN